MEKLTPFIMCMIFIFIAFCLWRLALKISSFAARRTILSYSRASVEATSVLLLSHFGELAVKTNKCLPVMTKSGKMYLQVDDIIIFPSCIAVVKVKSMSGQIFNNDPRTWHQSARLRSGERIEQDFPNPVVANERNIIALTKIFEREKIEVPPIHNIVIFSSEKVVFSEESLEVYTLTSGIEKLCKLSDGKKYSFRERHAMAKAINKYSLSPDKARIENRKVAAMVR